MSRSEILLESLVDFFADPGHAKTLTDILVHKTGVSLRRLESFITVLSRRDNINYVTKDGRRFNVHVAYKSSLVGYSKRLFDPFCRTDRVEFRVGSHTISTTVAQLNFIRWCIVNGVIDYIQGTGGAPRSESVQSQAQSVGAHGESP